MPNLETERFNLRGWGEADTDFVFDLYSRWEVQRYIGRVPRVMEDRSEAVERVARNAAFNHPIYGIWAIEDRESGHLAGALMLKELPASGPTEPLQPSGEIEIGWHLHPDWWGKGVATEAAGRVLEHAFASGLTRVVAVIQPANAASQRVATRIGMTHQGATDRFYNTVCEFYTIQQP